MFVGSILVAVWLLFGVSVASQFLDEKRHPPARPTSRVDGLTGGGGVQRSYLTKVK